MKQSQSTKVQLVARILPELAATAPYFSLATAADRMAELHLNITESSLKSYMNEAMKKGIVHGAGIPVVGRGEFQDMAWRLVTSGRVNMSALLQ
ncbi:MAG: hypothetical protein ACOYOU_00690 [Kiritimatiellia bacterium]